MYQEILKEAEKIGNEMVQWRRELHRIPEVGMNLPKTSAFVQQRLDEMGIPYEIKVNGSCIVGHLGKEGPCIMLRADMDALPIAEESGVEFASSNENMHADMICIRRHFWGRQRC